MAKKPEPPKSWFPVVSKPPKRDYWWKGPAEQPSLNRHREIATQLSRLRRRAEQIRRGEEPT